MLNLKDLNKYDNEEQLKELSQESKADALGELTKKAEAIKQYEYRYGNVRHSDTLYNMVTDFDKSVSEYKKSANSGASARRYYAAETQRLSSIFGRDIPPDLAALRDNNANKIRDWGLFGKFEQNSKDANQLMNKIRLDAAKEFEDGNLAGFFDKRNQALGVLSNLTNPSGPFSYEQALATEQAINKNYNEKGVALLQAKLSLADAQSDTFVEKRAIFESGLRLIDKSKLGIEAKTRLEKLKSFFEASEDNTITRLTDHTNAVTMFEKYGAGNLRALSKDSKEVVSQLEELLRDQTPNSKGYNKTKDAIEEIKSSEEARRFLAAASSNPENTELGRVLDANASYDSLKNILPEGQLGMKTFVKIKNLLTGRGKTALSAKVNMMRDLDNSLGRDTPQPLIKAIEGGNSSEIIKALGYDLNASSVGGERPRLTVESQKAWIAYKASPGVNDAVVQQVEQAFKAWGPNYESLYNSVTVPEEGLNFEGEVGLIKNNPGVFSTVAKNPSAARLLMQNKQAKNIQTNLTTYLIDKRSSELQEIAKHTGSSQQQVASTMALEMTAEAFYSQDTPLSFGRLRGLTPGKTPEDSTLVSLVKDRLEKSKQVFDKKFVMKSNYQGIRSSVLNTTEAGKKIENALDGSLFSQEQRNFATAFEDLINENFPVENRVDAEDISFRLSETDSTHYEIILEESTGIYTPFRTLKSNGQPSEQPLLIPRQEFEEFLNNNPSLQDIYVYLTTAVEDQRE